jgi:phytoene/squalene synthetase
LTNFWQDFGRDWRDGRLYVPRDVLEHHAACEDAVSADDRPDRHWQAVFGDVVARTRLLFDEGRDVSEAVRGRLRYELRATWLGGTTILDRTAELRERSFAARPTLTASDAVRLAPRAVWWRRGSRR